MFNNINFKGSTYIVDKMLNKCKHIFIDDLGVFLYLRKTPKLRENPQVYLTLALISQKKYLKKCIEEKLIYNTQCIGQESKVGNNDKSMDLISSIPEKWNYPEVEVN